ncbi:hypothetical protein TorRG33x02_110620 [Trema orientale]|uniref:Uncharacterized protein n=1 Tax=Trema orientale TaxID=63057 RepID=A0A2P5F5T7_TREOI|nr:hypothetical protein TorRG33x02_110620 [Trema orientale]
MEKRRERQRSRGRVLEAIPRRIYQNRAINQKNTSRWIPKRVDPKASGALREGEHDAYTCNPSNGFDCPTSNSWPYGGTKAAYRGQAMYVYFFAEKDTIISTRKNKS